ncbi:MAG: DNA-3-methyladenine glycosylase [Gemmatimonadota bacterium]|nr:DNA-3-methyladenine glycosylase [Gemmatimonadota bacterium]
MSTDAAPRARRPRLGAPFLPAFYDRDTELVARDLLGAVFSHASPEGSASGVIVETEAYLGEHDPACHAAVGRTGRTRWLYGPPGTAYVYYIYGAHWCVNAVTRAEGEPSAVLIRALEPLDGLDLIRTRRRNPKQSRDLTNGPGKLCAALGITGVHNGLSFSRSSLIIRRGRSVPDAEVVVTERIGITKAAEMPLRWYVKDNPWVSRTPTHFSRRPHRSAS